MIKFYNKFFMFFLSIYILIYFLYFNKSFFGLQFFYEIMKLYWFNIKYIFLVDGISFFFVILSVLLLLVCLLISWYLNYKIIIYLFSMFICVFCLINIFLTIDFIILFIFFELVVIPLFLFIGIWGSRERKIYAAYLLFFYTLFGSIFILFAFIFLFCNKGFSNFIYLIIPFFLENYHIILFFFIFGGFAVKVPIIGLHLWLPEAHVEAPTFGSIILAGIILKLSFYIYLRILIFNFKDISFFLIGLIFVIFIFSIYLSSFCALVQIDIKKIIAYSSISHMNFSLIGLFSNNLIGIFGSFFMMFGHAIVSSALFSSIGILYDRYKTRIIYYYGGLVLLIPLWSLFFFIYILGNFGLPGTINFVGEFIIFLGIFIFNNFLIIICLFSFFLTLIYCLFLYTRIVTGIIRNEFIRFFGDTTRREFLYLIFFSFFIFYFGLFPNLLFDYSFSTIFYWYFLIC